MNATLARIPDAVTIASRLRAPGRLAQVGGLAYVTEVLNAAPAIEPRRLGSVRQDRP